VASVGERQSPQMLFLETSKGVQKTILTGQFIHHPSNGLIVRHEVMYFPKFFCCGCLGSKPRHDNDSLSDSPGADGAGLLS
jgi:hypothetical protein